MEYQKIANLLENASNQPSKFRTRNWVKTNDESRGTYTGDNIKFKTTMLRSDLCDYTDTYHNCKGNYDNYWCRRCCCYKTSRWKK